MEKRNLTTITVYRIDKKRFDNLVNTINDGIMNASGVPEELYKKKSKADVFAGLMDLMEHEFRND